MIDFIRTSLHIGLQKRFPLVDTHTSPPLLWTAGVGHSLGVASLHTLE